MNSIDEDPNRDLTDKEVMKSRDVFEKLCRIVDESVIYVGDDPSLVKQFVKYLNPKDVLQGEEIIRQGDEGDYFYCIESGQYDVLVNGRKVSEFKDKVKKRKKTSDEIESILRVVLVKSPCSTGEQNEGGVLFFVSSFDDV